MVLDKLNSKADFRIRVKREVLSSVGFEVPHDLDSLGLLLSHMGTLKRVCGYQHIVQVRSVDSCLFLGRSKDSFSVDQSRDILERLSLESICFLIVVDDHCERSSVIPSAKDFTRLNR